MPKPKITVLLSVWNEEKYIGQTIKSVLDQTYSNFSLWIIDDGSTDSTYKVIKSFKDKRITCFHFDQNIGMTQRLNWAVPKTTTNYIARMDSHNLGAQERLQKQYEKMENTPKLMALGSNFIRVKENGEEIFRSNFPINYPEIKQKLMERNTFKHASMFFRREIYDKVGLYDPYFKVAQDYDFMLRIAGKYPVENLPDYLISETYREENMTQRFPRRSAWEALVAQVNGLTKYSYPAWQAIFLVRGLAFLITR